MGRPRQVLDEEILEAARACFIEHGASVSTETIAARLGVSGPALLKRFGSKRELLKAAFSIGHAPPWLPLVEEGPDTRELTVQLREIAQAIDTFFRKMVPAGKSLVVSVCNPEPNASPSPDCGRMPSQWGPLWRGEAALHNGVI